MKAEFGAWLALKHKEESKWLTNLVASAPTSLKYLPWAHYLEVKEFKKPDFTSI